MGDAGRGPDEQERAGDGDAKGDGDSELAAALAEQLRENERLKLLLKDERAHVQRYHKKLQFIEENQEMFNKLKEAYAATTANSGGAGVRLAEVQEAVRLVRDAADASGRRLEAALENERARQQSREQLYEQNKTLQRRLEFTNNELEQLRGASSTVPRELVLLRRILARLSAATPSADDPKNRLPGLTNRESVLARRLAEIYAPRAAGKSSNTKQGAPDSDKPRSDRSEYISARSTEEEPVLDTPYLTPRSANSTARDISYETSPRTIQEEPVLDVLFESPRSLGCSALSTPDDRLSSLLADSDMDF